MSGVFAVVDFGTSPTAPNPVTIAATDTFPLGHSAVLLWAFALRDLKSRYRGTALGWIWSTVGPVTSVAVMSVVSMELFIRPNADRADMSLAGYALFLLVGFVAWNAFARSQTLAIDTYRNAARILLSARVPPWIPSAGAVTVQLLQALIELSVVALAVIIFLGPQWTIVQYPAIIFLLYLFSLGLSLAVVAMSSRVPDTRQIVTLVLGIGFFATPVLYSETWLTSDSGVLHAWFLANPLSHYIGALRDSLLLGNQVSLSEWLLLACVSMLLLLVGASACNVSRDALIERL